MSLGELGFLFAITVAFALLRSARVAKLFRGLLAEGPGASKLLAASTLLLITVLHARDAAAGTRLAATIAARSVSPPSVHLMMEALQRGRHRRDRGALAPALLEPRRWS